MDRGCILAESGESNQRELMESHSDVKFSDCSAIRSFLCDQNSLKYCNSKCHKDTASGHSFTKKLKINKEDDIEGITFLHKQFTCSLQEKLTIAKS